jgi:hypothetical protein
MRGYFTQERYFWRGVRRESALAGRSPFMNEGRFGDISEGMYLDFFQRFHPLQYFTAKKKI